MSQILTINLSKPIISAKIADGYAGNEVGQLSGSEREDSQTVTANNLQHDSDAQRDVFSQACRILNNMIAELNRFCDKFYLDHAKEVARLSVEIARKILVQQVENGDYEIGAIIEEALKNVSCNQDVIVHLNPEDYETCRQAQQKEPECVLSGIKLISDPDIGRAECLVETPKGIIKSLIEDNLERIKKALEKAN